MSNTDFDPAKLNPPDDAAPAPAATPDFDPNKLAAVEFDPNKLAAAEAPDVVTAGTRLAGKLLPGPLGAVTAAADYVGLPQEIYKAGKQALTSLNDTFNPWSDASKEEQKQYLEAAKEHPLDFTPNLKRTLEVGKGVAAAPGLVAAPVTGAARVAIGKPFDAISPLTPEQKHKFGLESGEEAADTAMMGLRPAGAPVKMLPRPGAPAAPNDIPATRPAYEWDPTGKLPPTPTPVPDDSLGVTYSQGQRSGKLADIQREQAALRSPDNLGGPAHAQAQEFFNDQQPAQVAQAKNKVIQALGETEQHMPARQLSAQDAADSVTNALATQERARATQIANQERQLQAAHNQFRTVLGGHPDVDVRSPLDAATVISRSVNAAADAAQEAKNAAYTQAKEMPGEFHPAAFNKMVPEIQAEMARSADPVFIDPQRTPLAHAALGELDDMLSGLKQIRDPETGQIMPKPANTMARVDIARQRINSYLSNAFRAARADPGAWKDVHALGELVDAFDDAVARRINKGTFIGGDADAVNAAFQHARDLNTSYRRTFTPQGVGDKVGSAIRDIVGRHAGQEATAEQVNNMLYGKGDLPVKIGRRLLSDEVFGAQSPEAGALRQGLFTHITEAPPGKTAYTPAQVANRIESFTRGPGRSLTETYLGPEQVQALNDYARALRHHDSMVNAPRDAVDKLISELTGGPGYQTSNKYATDNLFQKALSGGKDSIELTNRLKQRLTPSQWVTFKQGLLRHAMEQGNGLPDPGFKRIADNLTKLANSQIGRVAYSPENQALIRQLADIHRKMVVPQGGANWSNNNPIVRGINALNTRVGLLVADVVAHKLGLPLGLAEGAAGAVAIGSKMLQDQVHLSQVRKQLPLVSESVAKYNKAALNYARSQNAMSRVALGAATANLGRTLQTIGVDVSKIPLQLPSTAPAQDDEKKRAGGGAVDDDVPFGNYTLTPEGIPNITVTPGDVRKAVGEEPLAPQPIAAPQVPLPLARPAEAPEPSYYDRQIAGPGEQRDIRTEGTGFDSLDKVLGLGNYTGDRFQTWPEQMVRSGTTLPGDAYSGATAPEQIQPTEPGFWSEEDEFRQQAANQAAAENVIHRAQDTAGLAGGSSFGAAHAGVIPENALGVFGGKFAKTANLAKLEEAKIMASQGQPQALIWQKTGWWEGRDGNWRFEIPDQNLSAQPFGGVKHPELLAAYPELAKVSTRVSPIEQEPSGEFIRYTGGPRPKPSEIRVRGTPETWRGTAAHELQHFVQNQEGWDSGGNLGGWGSDYYNLAGEVEARNVSDRLKLSPEARETISPRETQDTPFSRQILRDDVLNKKTKFDRLSAQELADLKKQYEEDFGKGSLEEHGGNLREYYNDYLGEDPSDTLRSDSAVPGAPLAALEKSATPFYSQLQRTIEKAPQQKMHGSQWANWLRNQPGIKQEELEWTGLGNYLNEQKGLVNKDQVLAKAKENHPELQEALKGEPTHSMVQLNSRIANALLDRGINRPSLEHEISHSIFGDKDYALQRLRDQGVDEPVVQEIAKYAQNVLEDDRKAPRFDRDDLKLPGGKNYRELLLKSPTVKYRSLPDGYQVKNVGVANDGQPRYLVTDRNGNEFAMANTPEQATYNALDDLNARSHPPNAYRSSHWPDDPNTVAHLRMNDRDIPGVGKSLHLEELQSDWGQAGRKQGYRQERNPADFTAEWNDKDGLWDATDSVTGRIYEIDPFTVDPTWPGAAQKVAQEAARRASVGGVPNMPFKQSWPDLLLKRAIREAAEQGKDAISWTPGEQQAARYDLSKHVQQISYDPQTKELWVREVGRSSSPRKVGNFSEEQLSNVIGKGAAEKIVNKKDTKNVNGMTVLEGDNLKVGGGGMKAFYDKMLVDKANAIGKKYGAKVEWKDLAPSEENIFNMHEEGGRYIIKNDTTGQKLGDFGDPNVAKARVNDLRAQDKLNKEVKVPVLKLTPKLKDAALKEGFALFSDTGKPGAAISAVQKSLTPKEQDLLSRWHKGFETYEDFPDWGKLKRNPRLDELFNKFPVHKGPVYRGVSLSKYNINQLKPGMVLEAHQPASASMQRNAAVPFMHWSESEHAIPVMFEMVQTSSRQIPKRPFGPNEHEVIVPRGTKFKIDKIVPENDGGEISGYTVKLKEVPKSTRASRKLSDTGISGPLNANSQQQEVPGEPGQEPYAGKEDQPQYRAAGGRVEPKNINHSPSEAQKQAGNYAKDKVHIHGLEISIENPRGSTRRGIGPNGPWSAKLACHYGYLLRQPLGKDGDHLDVYLGPHLKSKHVFVIDQVNANTGKFDEHKICLCFVSKTQALAYYKKCFSDGKGHRRVGNIVELTLPQLKHWLANGDMNKPIAAYGPIKAFAA